MSAVAPADARRARSGVAQIVAAWLPVLAWLGVIWCLSSDRFSKDVTAGWWTASPTVAALDMSPQTIDTANVILRKTAHFVEYAVLSMLGYRALGATATRRRRGVQLFGAVLLAMACSAVDEWRQANTLTRTGSPWDAVLDGCGAIAGALLGGWSLYWRSARRRA
ncbi:MAG: VanZ family protein [Candidatus Binatia bacterium]